MLAVDRTLVGIKRRYHIKSVAFKFLIREKCLPKLSCTCYYRFFGIVVSEKALKVTYKLFGNIAGFWLAARKAYRRQILTDLHFVEIKVVCNSRSRDVAHTVCLLFFQIVKIEGQSPQCLLRNCTVHLFCLSVRKIKRPAFKVFEHIGCNSSVCLYI